MVNFITKVIINIFLLSLVLWAIVAIDKWYSDSKRNNKNNYVIHSSYADIRKELKKTLNKLATEYDIKLAEYYGKKWLCVSEDNDWEGMKLEKVSWISLFSDGTYKKKTELEINFPDNGENPSLIYNSTGVWLVLKNSKEFSLALHRQKLDIEEYSSSLEPMIDVLVGNNEKMPARTNGYIIPIAKDTFEWKIKEPNEESEICKTL